MARFNDMRHLRTFPLIAGVLILIFTGGCARSTRDVPRADYRHGPLPHQERRSTDWVYEDFLLRSPDDYDRLEHLDEDELSTDQRLIVQEFGMPDFERTFWALSQENVQEWLDIDDNLCLQFVEGELVFQGPTSDMEHTILRYGVPSEVLRSMGYAGVERITFIYTRRFTPSQMHFSFANGALILEETLN